MKFREYQLDIIDKAMSILMQHNLVYLGMEVRTGKKIGRAHV